MRLQREVAGVKEADDRAGNVAFERLRTGRQEEGIVLAPYCQERRPVRAEVILESWEPATVSTADREQQTSEDNSGTCAVACFSLTASPGHSSRAPAHARATSRASPASRRCA